MLILNLATSLMTVLRYSIPLTLIFGQKSVIISALLKTLPEILYFQKDGLSWKRNISPKRISLRNSIGDRSCLKFLRLIIIRTVSLNIFMKAPKQKSDLNLTYIAATEIHTNILRDGSLRELNTLTQCSALSVLLTPHYVSTTLITMALMTTAMIITQTSQSLLRITLRYMNIPLIKTALATSPAKRLVLKLSRLNSTSRHISLAMLELSGIITVRFIIRESREIRLASFQETLKLPVMLKYSSMVAKILRKLATCLLIMSSRLTSEILRNLTNFS